MEKVRKKCKRTSRKTVERKDTVLKKRGELRPSSFRVWGKIKNLVEFILYSPEPRFQALANMEKEKYRVNLHNYTHKQAGSRGQGGRRGMSTGRVTEVRKGGVVEVKKGLEVRVMEVGKGEGRMMVDLEDKENRGLEVDQV